MPKSGLEIVAATTIAMTTVAAAIVAVRIVALTTKFRVITPKLSGLIRNGGKGGLPVSRRVVEILVVIPYV
jgi:hypothetical protein